MGSTTRCEGRARRGRHGDRGALLAEGHGQPVSQSDAGAGDRARRSYRYAGRMFCTRAPAHGLGGFRSDCAGRAIAILSILLERNSREPTHGPECRGGSADPAAALQRERIRGTLDVRRALASSCTSSFCALARHPGEDGLPVVAIDQGLRTTLTIRVTRDCACAIFSRASRR